MYYTSQFEILPSLNITKKLAEENIYTVLNFIVYLAHLEELAFC